MSRALIDWLIDGVPGATQPADVAERIGVELTAAGVPIDRLTVFVTTLHPTVAGRQFRWRPGVGASVAELSIEAQGSAAWKASPVAAMMRDGKEVRQRLGELLPGTWPILDDLRADGFTDYLCSPLVFTSGEVHGVTYATRAPAGFTGAHLDTLRSISSPLARVAEIFALRRVATTLLSTYVGRGAGAKILQGRITRGDVELLRAVIWFSDLRGFTELSSRCAPPAIIGVLNELFDCQVPAIERHGGEVLKFIGDGVLAIFTLGSAADVRERCAGALAAAREAFEAVAARNAARKLDAEEPIRFGLALHVGEVAYGNIGGASRLDFTAIGPAVNLAARLEGLTGKLDRQVVLSSDLAEHAGVPLVDLGEFDLKGVPGRTRAFGLA